MRSAFQTVAALVMPVVPLCRAVVVEEEALVFALVSGG
jgi:hypothetical protein